ncbi:hypothetical protein FG386_002968 [Cryptosporidium ryanae]|uniref:uncharacterized protein n=1 Tax=Cryptosporidium ryanae TaxID=515981 RepID=UPI00351A1968|nr:hypothetical protein FG386_002968 [Cryptosporidium ryanae]
MSAKNEEMRKGSSNLLVPLHSIGFVTDDVPFCLEKIGDEYFIVVATGNYYQVYDLDQLRIKYISRRMDMKICGLATKYESVYVSMGNKVEGYNRHEKIFELNKHSMNILGMLVLGEYLVSWDEESVLVSDLNSDFLVNKLELDLDANDKIVSIIHPETYLNKVLVVMSRGCELWNVNTNKKIHRFKSIDEILLKSRFTGFGLANLNSKFERVTQILSTAKSSHPDIIGIGTQNGFIYTLDIANDIILVSLEHMPEQKGITSMSFCTEKTLLSSGCENGDVVVWDLENARVMHILESVHESKVVKIQFVPGVSIFVTSGCDNSILEFVIDNVEKPPRELRSRRGHLNSIEKMSFYNALPEKSCDLICFSNYKNSGYLGKTSTIQQHQNRIFSQNSLKKRFNEKQQFPFNRLPPVLDFSFAESRHYDWPNIVTIHKGMHEAFIWSGHNFALTQRLLTLENTAVSSGNKQSKYGLHNNYYGLTAKKRALPIAKAISVSECGNYVVVGYENGSVYRFNLQSGICSGELLFPKDSGIHLQTFQILSIHFSLSTLVICISMDLNNYYATTWSIKPIGHLSTNVICNRLNLDDPKEDERFISRIFGYLLAFGFSDGKVILYDFQSQVVSREFQHKSHKITDISISSDYRWILVSTISGELFIYDMISSVLIDWVKFNSPVLCCVFDHSNSFIITSHDNSKGVLSIWANKKALTVSSGLDGFSSAPSEPFLIEDPPERVLYFENSETVPDPNKKKGARTLSEPDYKLNVKPELNDDKNIDLSQGEKLMSFSGIPFSTLQAILYIDEIKERNKPIEPPKKPESVPFFLPNTTDLPKLALKNKEVEVEESNNNKKASSKIIDKVTGDLVLKTELQEMLTNFNSENITDITDLLKSKSPSGVNYLIKQLGPLSGGGFDEISKMILYFNYAILNKADSELIQTYLNLFLTTHSTTIIENKEEFQHLKEEIDRLNFLVLNEWESLQNRLQSISCFLKFVTNIQMD